MTYSSPSAPQTATLRMRAHTPKCCFGKRETNFKSVGINALRIHFHLTSQMSCVVWFLFKRCFPEHSQWMFQLNPHLGLWVWYPDLTFNTCDRDRSRLLNEDSEAKTQVIKALCGDLTVRTKPEQGRAHLTWWLCTSLGCKCPIYICETRLCVVHIWYSKIHYPLFHRQNFRVCVWTQARVHLDLCAVWGWFILWDILTFTSEIRVYIYVASAKVSPESC